MTEIDAPQIESFRLMMKGPTPDPTSPVIQKIDALCDAALRGIEDKVDDASTASPYVSTAADAVALLREWKATELDSMDEEFQPWLDSFTKRVDAVLAMTPETASPELQEYRKQELYDLMSGISEECYCAGWMHGNEFRLWDAITDPNDDRRYGMGEIQECQVHRLRELAHLLNGWWVWEDDAAFISLDEWKRRLAAMSAEKHTEGK